MIETIGIVGGGQLGRMLTEPAHRLGFGVVVIDPTENCPAAQVGADQIRADLHDEEALGVLAGVSDVMTWEIEHIPAGTLMDLAAHGTNIEPAPWTLAVIQDKLAEKEFLQEHGIPVAPFSSRLDERDFLGRGPYIVKSRHGGFDGRGNLLVQTLDDPAIALQYGDQSVYVEQVLAFEKELAVIAARNKQGYVATYPAVETIQEDNICNVVLSPADIAPDILNEADEVAQATMELLDGAGVFAIEMFVVNGHILVNEIAPRVHNSGHLTIEAHSTSQFEQHIRAITGMPLGDTNMRVAAAAMINVLGTRTERLNRTGLETVLALPDTYPHFYGKDPRPARKIGHITILGDSLASVRQQALYARGALSV